MVLVELEPVPAPGDPAKGIERGIMASLQTPLCRVLNIDKKIAYEITLHEDASDLIPLESKGMLDDSKLLEIIKDIGKK